MFKTRPCCVIQTLDKPRIVILCFGVRLSLVYISARLWTRPQKYQRIYVWLTQSDESILNRPFLRTSLTPAQTQKMRTLLNAPKNIAKYIFRLSAKHLKPSCGEEKNSV